MIVKNHPERIKSYLIQYKAALIMRWIQTLFTNDIQIFK